MQTTARWREGQNWSSVSCPQFHAHSPSPTAAFYRTVNQRFHPLLAFTVLKAWESPVYQLIFYWFGYLHFRIITVWSEKITENGWFLLISPLIRNEARRVYLYSLIHKVILKNSRFSPKYPFHQPVAWWICICLGSVSLVLILSPTNQWHAWIIHACLSWLFTAYTVVVLQTTQKIRYRTLELKALRIVIRDKRRKKMVGEWLVVCTIPLSA